MPRPMSPTHTFRFKPNGQIPFENVAQAKFHLKMQLNLSYINQPHNLNSANPHLNKAI